MGAMASDDVSELVSGFRFDRLLNQDQAGRRVCLLGSIAARPAILLVERATLPSESEQLKQLAGSLDRLELISSNDVYSWFLAHRATPRSGAAWPDYKVNLIYPCTESQIRKYGHQKYRIVDETAELYREHVRPFIEKRREPAHLNWVYNILDGREEQKDILYREEGPHGFVVMPDLNWDRKSHATLHLLCIPVRRDVWTLRDLTKADVDWLRRMRTGIRRAATSLSPEIEASQLKLYVHYQPTFYHFHVHAVHTDRESDNGQAAGKAFMLEHIISQLDSMASGASMADVALAYSVGEASELWQQVLSKLAVAD